MDFIAVCKKMYFLNFTLLSRRFVENFHASEVGDMLVREEVGWGSCWVFNPLATLYFHRFF
jgi:hypothetical protein